MSCVKRLNFSFSCDSPENFVTSQWQSDKNPSVKFLIYRVLLACYFTFVFILSLITAEKCNQLGYYTIYLTNWNVMLNFFTMVFGAVLAALYYAKKIRFDSVTKEMTKVLKVYWLFMVLSTCVCISLSLIYWPLIYTGRDKGLTDALTHAGNAIVLLVDIFINAHPPRFGHFVYPLSFGVIYGFVFSVPYIYLGGTDRDLNNYIYSISDWKDHTVDALLFSLATMVFLSIMHFVLTALIALRVFIYRKIRSQSTQSSQLNLA